MNDTGSTAPLPREALPEPVYEAAPELVDLYWEAWRMAWNHVVTREGAPQSPYMDEAFCPDTVWIWDTCFMAHFCKYGHTRFPGIESFDNFYLPLHDGTPSSLTIHHPDNPPLFAWTEYAYARFTGNTERIQRILLEKEYLQKHYRFFHEQPPPGTPAPPGARVPNDLHWTGNGYLWSGNASGMDNTPRGRGYPPGRRHEYEHMLWVDALAQQALAARHIARLADLVHASSLADEFREKHARLRDLLNRYYWDEDDGIYYDVLAADPGTRIKVRTPASFWPLLADCCSQEQADRLAEHARDPMGFGGEAPWPTLARNDPDYHTSGLYWRGGIWLPTAYMATKALEEHGHMDLADELALRLLRHMQKTYEDCDPHTIWECYRPEDPQPATDKDDRSRVRPDFCGWSALGPISLFIENVLGFHVIDGLNRRVEWRCRPERGVHGLRQLHFGGVTANLLRRADGSIEVTSNAAFTLAINGREVAIAPRHQVLP
jgi:hypothetical protein